MGLVPLHLRLFDVLMMKMQITGSTNQRDAIGRIRERVMFMRRKRTHCAVHILSSMVIDIEI